jgi:hypothetical protein
MKMTTALLIATIMLGCATKPLFTKPHKTMPPAAREQESPLEQVGAKDFGLQHDGSFVACGPSEAIASAEAKNYFQGRKTRNGVQVSDRPEENSDRLTCARVWPE